METKKRKGWFEGESICCETALTIETKRFRHFKKHHQEVGQKEFGGGKRGGEGNWGVPKRYKGMGKWKGNGGIA